MAVFGFFKKGFDPEVYERELTVLTELILATQQQVGLLERRYRDVRRVWIQWLVMLYVVLTAYNWMQLPNTTPGANHLQRYFRGLLQRQWVAVLAFPIALWATLKVIHWLFNYLIRRRQNRLKLLQNKHTAKIDELKQITNFNTTSKLLKKYSKESEPQPAAAAANGQRAPPPAPRGAPGAGSAPVGAHQLPPTANVARPRNPTEEKILRQLNLDIDVPEAPSASSLQAPSAQVPHALSLAPGARAPLPAVDGLIQRRLQEQQHQRLWGDRVLDLLLGLEHNELVENRYALVCHNCFAHNGLAPPGCANPLQVKYVCFKCGALNGDFSNVAPDSETATAAETSDDATDHVTPVSE